MSEIIHRAIDVYLGYRIYVSNLQSQDNNRQENRGNT